MRDKPIIAIDGPAGAGKSTIAKKVAEKVGVPCIDTGALYRALGLSCIRAGADTNSEDESTAVIENLDISIRYIDGVQHVFVKDEDLTEYIRTNEVSMAASNVSKYPAVREKLLDLQRKTAKENGAVLEGRDIGTVVLPDADVKIFLTASAVERAHRRTDELLEKGETVDFEVILQEIRARDLQDSTREIAPLKKAEDAVEVDSTGKSIDDVLEIIYSYCI